MSSRGRRAQRRAEERAKLLARRQALVAARRAEAHQRKIENERKAANDGP